MDTGDIEDPRELAAREAFGRTRLAENHQRRIEILHDNLGSEDMPGVRDYLEQNDPVLLQFEAKNRLLSTILSFVSAERHLPISAQREVKSSVGYMRLLGMHPVHESNELDRLPANDLYFQDDAAEARAITLLLRKNGEPEPEKYMKREFFYQFGRLFFANNREAPPALRFLLPREQFDNITKAEEAIKHRPVSPERLDELLAAYPNLDELANRIFNLKDGKLPV